MKLAVLTGLGFYLSLLTAEVFAQEEEFKCPAFTKLTDKIHLFPDPTQCDKYFECRNGLSKRVICQDGLVFHPEKPEGEDPCDLKHNTPDKCKTRPELQRPKPGDSHCPRQNGVYPSEDPFECDVFYSCLNGVGSPTRCAEGLHFSEDIGTCVWARESGRAGCVSEQNRSQKKMTDKKPADDTPTTQKPKSLENGFTCPGGALGVHPALPHPTSCRQYYICLDGITATEAGCTKGRVFNPGTQQCDSPQNVPGCEDFYDEKAKQKKVELADSLGTNVGDKDFSKFLTLLKMSGVLKEGAQLDAVLQGQSLSQEDSGSLEGPASNARPGRPGRRGPGRRPGGRNRPNRRRPNRPRPALFNVYEEDEYEDYEDYEDEEEEEEVEEEKITTLAPEPAAPSRPENSLFPSRSKTSFAERFRPKVNLVNVLDNKKKFDTAEDEKSMIANEDTSAANAAELGEKPRRNPFSKPEKSSRTEPTKSVGLMTLSGPDAEALFQSLIRDDPSAVGVVDTTTPPPSIQPTSSLESTTQEQRHVQQPRALSRKFLFPRPRGLIQEDRAEEVVEEEDVEDEDEDVKDEEEVEEEENVEDEQVVESRTSDDKRPTLPGRSSFRNNFFRGKGRPSRPSFLKAEEPAEDEENSRKEQLIEQEEEVEKEEEVTFSKPSNFRASMSKSKLRESIRKSVESQKNAAPEINEIEPRTESKNFKLLVTPHPAIEEPEEVIDSKPDTNEMPAVVRGIKRKRPSFVRTSLSETKTENNNEISTEDFEDVTDLPEPSAPVRRIKGKGQRPLSRKEQTRTQDLTPIPKPMNSLQKLFQPQETTVSEPLSEPTLPSVESRGETILAAVVSLSATTESPAERGQNLLASLSGEPAENQFTRFNTAGSRFPVFAATPAPVPSQSSFVSSSDEELPISLSSSFTSSPVLSPQTSSSFSSAPSGNFFAQFPTSPSLDTQNFQRISFPGVPAVPSGVPAAPIGVPAVPRGASLSSGSPQDSRDSALVNREPAQSRQPLPFTSFTQNPPSSSHVRDFQTSFRGEESPHVALPFLQREDDSLQGAAIPVRSESNFLRGPTQFTAFREGQARSVFQPSSSSQGRTLFQTNIADQARTVSTPELGGQPFQPSQADQGRFSTQTLFQNSGSSFPFPSLFDQGSQQSAHLTPIQQTQSQFTQTPNRFTARNQFSSPLQDASSFQLSPTLPQSPFQTALHSIPTRQFVNRRAEDLEDDPMQIVAERLRTRLSSVLPEAANEGDALEILREKVNRSKNANRARG